MYAAFFSLFWILISLPMLALDALLLILLYLFVFVSSLGSCFLFFFVPNFLLFLFFILLIILRLLSSSSFVCSSFSSFCFVFFFFFLRCLADCWLIVCLSHCLSTLFYRCSAAIRPSLGRSPTIVGYPTVVQVLSGHPRPLLGPHSAAIHRWLPPFNHCLTTIRPSFSQCLANHRCLAATRLLWATILPIAITRCKG